MTKRLARPPRIRNTHDGQMPRLTPAEALSWLKQKHIGEHGILPLAEANEILYMAYPHCVRRDDDGERSINWRFLLHAVLRDFVDAYQTGGEGGRPKGSKYDALTPAELRARLELHAKLTGKNGKPGSMRKAAKSMEISSSFGIGTTSAAGIERQNRRASKRGKK